MKKENFVLYENKVKLEFNPDSPKYRYVVSDPERKVFDKSVRGVTSILKDIIAKPALMTWAMNMSHSYIFATKFDEVLKDYTHDWKKSAIKPETTYTEEELHDIFKEGSKQWTKRSDKGKDVGHITHRSVELYLKGESSPVEKAIEEAEKIAKLDSEEDKKEFLENIKCVKKAFKAFREWWDAIDDKKILYLERPIYSRQMDYCGTFDMLVEIGGRTYLLDLKTTNSSRNNPLGIYAENFLQLGAYSFALKEETGIVVNDVGIIRVSKAGQLSIATAGDLGIPVDLCERAFAFALRLHDVLSMVTPFLSDAHFKSHLSTVQVEEQA